MSKPGKAIPEGYHSVTPYLTIRGAAAAIEFYKQAFGAIETLRLAGGPDGQQVMHGEIRIGDSIVMLSDEFPEMGALSPTHFNGATGSLMIYVEDCDATLARAVAAGATVTMPLADMFWGDRMGQVRDPFGHKWSVATHKLDLSPEEIAQARQAAGW